MKYQVNFKVNDNIYLRDPESSELGKQIVKNGIDLIYTLGYENFTFKKLAIEIGTTEASIYRYFENKHRLLMYILNWYWSYLEFLVHFQINNISDPRTKLKAIIELLTQELPDIGGQLFYNKQYLSQIVITDSSKVYLVKEVNEINEIQVFKPFKDLCESIATIITEYAPQYPFPRSLSSTLIETAHYQHFFSSHMPRLTDISSDESPENFVQNFLENLVFNLLSEG